MSNALATCELLQELSASEREALSRGLGPVARSPRAKKATALFQNAMKPRRSV